MIMLRRLSFLLAFGLFLLVASSAQETPKEKKLLKNADILLMVQNHFDDDMLVKVIEVSDTDFDISGDALIGLKNQGVSSGVLRAMLQATQKKRRAANQASTTPASTPSADSTSSAPGSSSNANNPAPSPDKSLSTENAGNSANLPSEKHIPLPLATASAASSQQNSMVTQNANATMDFHQPQMAALQSQMTAMGMGGIFANLLGGSSSMSYSPEQMPHVFLMNSQIHGEKHEVTPSIAQMAQTKYKSGAPGAGGSALRSLATEGLSFAAMGGGPAAMMAMSAFSMASGFMPGMRPGAPSLTYVWGLPGRKSSREFNDRDPIFQLSYGDIPGVDPDAFEPAIVQLVQTPDNYRLVGATRTKLNSRNMMSGGAPENGKWISEERWPTRVYKEDRGFYVLRVDQPLEPGEYAVVLRPVKGYKATPSGLGGHAQVFYSVWDFSVPGAPPEDIGKKKKK